MLVNDILRTKGNDIFHIHPDKSVFEAIKEMADKNVGALLVMDNSELKGIISERDYRNKVILKGRTSKETQVREIMTEQLYVVSPEESVEECMTLMTERKIRHLPVLKQQKVVGVVSIGDLVKSIISKQEVQIQHLHQYISGTYPA